MILQGKTLDWMYDGPSALVNREDYLLGRKVDKSFQMLEAAEKGNSAWLSEAEKGIKKFKVFNPVNIDILTQLINCNLSTARLDSSVHLKTVRNWWSSRCCQEN